MATIVDIALALVFLIALIVGLVRGFAKQLTGFLKGFMCFLISEAITILILKAIINTQFILNFRETTSSWFTAEVFTTSVSSVEELQTLLKSAGFWSFMNNFADKVYASMTGVGATTIGQLFGYYTAVAIAQIVIWLLTYIILKLLFKGLGNLLDKIAKLPVINTIDRLLGAAWAVIFTYLILIGLVFSAAEIVVANWVQGSAEAFAQFIAESKLLKLAHETNFVGNAIAEAFSFQLLTLPSA